MAYQTELDISSELTTSEVEKIALDLGCTANLVIANGPGGGNPVYEFASDSFNNLKELIEQAYGAGMDEEQLKTMIWEV